MSERIADALVRRGLLNRRRADLALRDRKRTGLSFGQLVVERHWVPDDVYADVLAVVFGVPRVRLETVTVDRSIIADLGETWVRSEQMLPLHVIPGRREVLVASTDPENDRGAATLEFRLGRGLKIAPTSRADFESLIRFVFQREPLPRYSTGSLSSADIIGDREALALAVSENRQAAEALRVIFELCVERGLLTHEDLNRRMRDPQG